MASAAPPVYISIVPLRSLFTLRANMRKTNWIILLLTLFTVSSARVPKPCSSPGQYPLTKLHQKFSSRTTFNSGEKVYYDCAEDFAPSRGSRSVQCADGRWTKLSLKCEKRSCGNAGDLLNGRFIYEGNSYIGEKVNAVCNRGYTLKGMNYMICKSLGWTGDSPVCVASEKKDSLRSETTCAPPAVSDAVQSGDVSVHRPGDHVTFTCLQGLRLQGAQHITCGADGQWRPAPPQCLLPPLTTQPPTQAPQRPSHSDPGCGVPPHVGSSHANLADKYITRTSFNSGDKVYYVCDVGYAGAGGSRTRLCNNGEWTEFTLQCERKLCGSAGEVENGEFVYDGVQFGDTAKAVCKEGFLLVGRATRRCTNDGWDGRIPVCEAVDCGEPPEVKNAEKQGPKEPPYFYRTAIRYQCKVGTLVGQKDIWCTNNGTWSGPAPQCKELTCPPPNVPNAYWTSAHKLTFNLRETVSIECVRGFVRTGPGTISCNANGRWSPRRPRCQRLLQHAVRS